MADDRGMSASLLRLCQYSAPRYRLAGQPSGTRRSSLALLTSHKHRVDVSAEQGWLIRLGMSRHLGSLEATFASRACRTMLYCSSHTDLHNGAVRGLDMRPRSAAA